jgi:hypothetical protein
MLCTILSNNNEHGGVTGECHNPNRRILFTYSRIGGGISTKNERTYRKQKKMI